jgi:hypothetical protein
MPFDIGGFIYNGDRIENDARAGIITDGLVLHLDASIRESYPRGGDTWYDLSGNGNHFTLYNSPVYTSSRFFSFDGVNDYMRSTNTINLSGTNQITVDIGFRVHTVTTNAMAFEFTDNWNTNAGAFGVFTNSTGGFSDSPSTDNIIHTNSAAGTENFNVTSTTTPAAYHFMFQSGNVTTYYNNTLATKLINPTHSTFTNFANSHLYLGSRGGASLFGLYDLYYVRLYNRVLTTAEIAQNYNVTKRRFGV